MKKEQEIPLIKASEVEEINITDDPTVPFKQATKKSPRSNIIELSNDDFTQAKYTDSTKAPDLIDTLEDETKSEIHLSQHFDCEREVLSFGSSNPKGIFLVNSNKEFQSAESLKNRYNLIGIPSAQVSVKVVRSYLKDDPVEIEKVYNELFNLIRRFVVLQDAALYHVLALSVILTYCYQIFTHVPFIWLSAEKNSGKTTLLNVLSLLSFNPMQTSGSSVSSLFRSIEGVDCQII